MRGSVFVCQLVLVLEICLVTLPCRYRSQRANKKEEQPFSRYLKKVLYVVRCARECALLGADRLSASCASASHHGAVLVLCQDEDEGTDNTKAAAGRCIQRCVRAARRVTEWRPQTWQAPTRVLITP